MVSPELSKLVDTCKGLTDYTLDPHQVEGLKFLMDHHYCLLADEQGVGKTLQAVMVSLIEQSPTVIVAPSSLIPNWKHELESIAKRSPDVRTFKKLKDPLTFHDDGFAEFVLLTYDQVKYSEKIFKWADTIIVDECQFLKTETTQRYIFFESWLFEGACNRLILASGTPIENRVEELYTTLSLLSYTIKKTNGINILIDYPTKTSFCNKFSFPRKVRQRGMTRIVWEGLQNVEELRKLMEHKVLRRKSEDVQDLPPIVEKQIVTDYKDDPELLNDWEKHNEDTADKGADSRAKRNSALLKAPFTVKFAKEQLAFNEAVVIFSDHPDAAEYIGEKLNFPVITGMTTPKKRDKLVRELQAGKHKGLSCTIGSASTGFTMTLANVLIFNDINWNPAKNDQARKRIHRRGQDKACTIWFVIGSIQDLHITRKTREKMKVIKSVLDFKSEHDAKDSNKKSKKTRRGSAFSPVRKKLRKRVEIKSLPR